jgi:hypothetical protein
MATNNLRIVYNNVANSATLTASSTRGATDINFTKKDTKSLVWQATGTTATITVDMASAPIVGAVILAFNNFSSTATMRVQGYYATVLQFDTGVQQAAAYAPMDDFPWGDVPIGANAYSFAGGSYGRAYFAQTSVDQIVITIDDPDNVAGYLEVSRLIVGPYWSPVFNHPYGASYQYVDDSTQYRTEGNNLVSHRAGRFNKVTFNLEYMQTPDRSRWNELVKKMGMHSPIFVSLYPEDADPEKEQSFQLYGKLTQISATTHPMYTMYATNVEVEEI